jgi:hypothetical protein
VIRDPKEVLVSSYYFLGGMIGVLDRLSIDDWFDVFMRPKGLASAWAEHSASFWRWRDRPNVLVLTYGEIKASPESSIARVARVMGVELSGAEMAEVVNRSGFEYMKARESKFAPPLLPGRKESERPKMLRRGQTGSSEELLSRAQQAAVDERCQAELQRRDSDFPYATAFEVATDPTP